MLWKDKYSTQLQKKKAMCGTSLMKIKKKIPIKLRLAEISKKSVPSEVFQPEDRQLS